MPRYRKCDPGHTTVNPRPQGRRGDTRRIAIFAAIHRVNLRVNLTLCSPMAGEEVPVQEFLTPFDPCLCRHY